jgi:hypothetical protein
MSTRFAMRAAARLAAHQRRRVVGAAAFTNASSPPPAAAAVSSLHCRNIAFAATSQQWLISTAQESALGGADADADAVTSGSTKQLGTAARTSTPALALPLFSLAHFFFGIDKDR